MKLSALYLAGLTSIPFFTFSAVIPDVASHKEAIAKRGGEVNYLANCVVTKGLFTPSTYHVSHIAWYANVDNSLSGLDVPDSLSNEYRDWAAGGEYIHWEGQQQNIYFADSGVTVQTHIDSDAQSKAFTQWAGWAQRTSDWKYFNCYKDNGRRLYGVVGGNSDGPYVMDCSAIYWCV